MRLVLSVVCLLAVLPSPARPALLVQALQSPSLYERLDGAYPIAVVVDAFIERLLMNTTLHANPANRRQHEGRHRRRGGVTPDHASASVVNAWHAGLLTLAIVATSPPATRTAADARPCDDAIRDPQPLRIRIASQPDVDEDVLAQARIEVEMIWRPYGIAVVWQRSWWNDTDARQPVLFVHIVGTPARVDNADHTLAWLLVADGRPLPYARVSLPATMRRVATASLFEGKSLADAPREVQRQALGRVIGRALAHEIGHFLLGSTEHASVGLMAHMIEGPLLVHPGRGYFTLTRAEVRALRAARLERCERARHAAR